MSGATFQALLMIGAPCDPFYSNVVFLSSFEQAQTSGFGLTEQSPLGAIVTFSQPYNNNGPSQSCVSSLNPEYGGASARSDNTTSASLPFNPAYRISPANSSPFTIEYSLYQTDANVVGDNYVAFSTLVASGNYGWMIRHTGGSMDFFWSTDGTNILSISAPGVITTANAWVKYAVTKNASGLIRLFKNGIQVASATPANSAFFASTGGLSMCASAPAQQCYMDNGRITAGVCRYDAASYAVATGPFPTIACYGWASYDGVASNATLSNNNRTVVHTNTIVGGARSTSLKNSGKYYHEITWDASISGQDSGNGLLTAAGTYANLAAGAINGIAVFRNDGGIYCNGVNVAQQNVGPIASGDRMDIATDFTNAKVWYRRNGRDWNSAGVGGFTAFYMATTLSATLTNGSLTVTSTGLSYAKSQHFRSTGKFYFEITIALWNNTSDGLGVTTLAAGYTAMTTPTTGSMMFRTTGNIYSGGTNSGKQLGVINNGDVIGVAVDLTNSKIWYRKSPSGNWNGLAIGSENPATNTGGVALPSVDVTAGLSPGVSLQTTTTPTVTANFGNSAFSGAVPAGFTAGWPNFGADAATNVGGVSIAAVLSGTTMSPAIDFSGPGTAAGEGITANFGNAAFGGAVPSGFVPGWTL